MFTLQVVRRPGEAAEQYRVLAEGREDCRAGLASALRAMIGGEGSIVAYNASFEWIETNTIRMNDKSLVSR